MIGTLDGVVLDCPDASVLARFYAELIGGTVSGDAEWSELVPERPGPRPLLAFQQVQGYRAPVWPGQEQPQQIHLDVRVDDLDAGERAVLELGATATGSEKDSFRVYLDPAGHPFCLVHPGY